MEDLSKKDYIQIIRNRDPRYDGRFFFAVVTTGIYCRPVCPARPKEENISILKSSAEAERQGFRPCKRCKPDIGPGFKIYEEKYKVLDQAMAIMDQSTEDLSVESLSDQLNLSSRHLRRLFVEYFGIGPNEAMQSRRLHLAKNLLLGTKYSVTDIAMGVGFGSIRRFNESFKELYKVSPSQMRKEKVGKAIESAHFKIYMRPPFHSEYMFSFLSRHRIPGVEWVTKNSYIRYLSLDEDKVAKVHIKYIEKDHSLEVYFYELPVTRIKTLLMRLKKLFDSDHNPAFLKDKDTLGARVPGAFDGFEVAVSIVLGQLISTDQAMRKMEKLVKTYGTPTGNFEEDGNEVILFPDPEVLKDAEIEEIGVTKMKANAIREIAKLVYEKKIDLDFYVDREKNYQQLASIAGVGKWTLSMIGMRCFGDTDSFPDNDLIVARAIERKLVEPEDWSPYRAYLCHYIWDKFARTLGKGKKNG